jgi:hypothetical protein
MTPPLEHVGTEPPEGVAAWGNFIDDRKGNERHISASIRALKDRDASGDVSGS